MGTAARYLILAFGWIFLGLAVIGMLLPVIPTTPFLLLAAACFMRSSERLHRWLLSHPRYGPLIADYLEGRGLTVTTKVVSIGTMWLSIVAGIVFFVPYPVADLLMLAVAISVTAYLLQLPTAPRK